MIILAMMRIEPVEGRCEGRCEGEVVDKGGV
jgi:hypothetical protein